MAPLPSGQAGHRLQSVTREQRYAADRRVRSARLVVDSMHEDNARALTRRRRIRKAGSLAQSAERRVKTDSSGAEITITDCVRMLRVDDRLVRNLEQEIDETRDLLGEYEELTVAYRHEVEACDAVLEDCRRTTRRRTRQTKTLVAAAALVALIVLLD
jgi:hypothetical protein